MIAVSSRGYLLASASILVATYAQLAMKWGMSHLPLLQENWSSIEYWLSVKLPAFFVLSGIAAYGLSLMLWLGALNFIPLNRAYPLLSLSYVLVYLATISLPWFNESFTPLCALGVFFISIGVWLSVTSSAKA